ncbi:hypothetical protein Aduo_013897 [Ancylostoma duodenale]
MNVALVTCTQSHVVLVEPKSATLHPRIAPQCHQRRVRTIYVENKAKCANKSHSLVVDISSIELQSPTSDLIVISCATLSREIIHDRMFSVHMDIQMSLGSEGSVNLEIVERNVILVAARYAVPTLCQIISEQGGEINVLQLTDEGGCVVSAEVAPFIRKLADRGTSYSARLNSSLFSGLTSSRIQCSVVACGELCIHQHPTLVCQRSDDRAFCSDPKAASEKIFLWINFALKEPQ